MTNSLPIVPSCRIDLMSDFVLLASDCFWFKILQQVKKGEVKFCQE